MPRLNKLAESAPPSRNALARAFREVNENEPAAVRRQRRKKGKKAAKKMKTAIALSKARRGDA